MSFQGYYIILCENGHLTESDCYDYDSSNTCYFCGSKEAWRQLIDQTNGNGDDQKWPLEIVKTDVYHVCDKGAFHLDSPAVYKIPNEKNYEYSMDEYEIEQILEEALKKKHPNLRVVSIDLHDCGGIVARYKTMPKGTDK